MNIENLSGAAIAALIGFLTGFLALLQQEGVGGVSDISEVAWWVLAVGAAISFLKDYQALATRRLVSSLKGEKKLFRF